MASRHVSRRTYGRTWIALMLLAALSFGLSFAPLGRLGAPVALTIAVVKAGLIAAFFMHLVEQPSTSRWAFAFGILLVCLLLVMVSVDELTRVRTGVEQPGLSAPAPPTRPVAR